jgi:hypothetical protein
MRRRRFVSRLLLANLPSAAGCAGRHAAATVRDWGFPELSAQASRYAAEVVAAYLMHVDFRYRELHTARIIVLIVRWEHTSIFVEATFAGSEDTHTWRQLTTTTPR